MLSEDDEDTLATEPLEVAIIDQVIAVPFQPTRAFLLVEESLGQVRRLPAQVISGNRPEALLLGKDRYLAGAAISRTLLNQLPERLGFVFFLIGADSVVATTPVRYIDKESIVENSKRVELLEDRLQSFQAKLHLEEQKLQMLEHEMRPLREEAAKIAGVDDIIDLKMELTRLKGFGEENVVEIERLKTLLELGRTMSDPPDIYQRKQKLSEHLREAAKATAMADRLNERRRAAAVSSLEKKIAMVRETKNYDREALAKQVLFLRAKRKQLEARLDIAPNQVEDQF